MRPWGVYAFFGTLVALATFIMWSAHKDDARLEAECEARGGVFVEARSPLHVCVKPLTAIPETPSPALPSEQP